MNLLNAELTVGRLVAEHPQLTRTFESLGIDYCCGGRRPLTQAVQEKGLDLAAVLARLEEAMQPGEGVCAQPWLERSMAELIAHIEESHHGYLRSELPRVQGLADKVARVHGEENPYLVRLREVFGHLRMELESHLVKEEQILFPAIRGCEARGAGMPQGPGVLGGPMHCMEAEHDDAGAALAEMRTLTGDFQPPEQACGTWRALYQALVELEQDLHRHVHEENNILFERVKAAGW